jgi:hypothetical protein
LTETEQDQLKVLIAAGTVPRVRWQWVEAGAEGIVQDWT